MNAHGRGQRKLTQAGQNAFPAWSPDGRKIIFVSDRDGNLELYVMKADGTRQTRLTRNPGVDGSPTWRPDGHTIACGCRRGGNFDIYLLSVATHWGEETRRLTQDPGLEADPSWSPNGLDIAFERKLGGASEIYVENVDSDKPRRLTSGGASADPAWSPDDRSIAFVRYGDIYVMDPHGGNVRRLTDTPAVDEFPSWLP
jgi:TolB protein